MTLFASHTDADSIFENVINEYFDKDDGIKTIELLGWL